MELELKHIDHYLRHGLKAIILGSLDIISEVDFEHGIVTGLNNGNCLVKDIKLALHPLSEYCGETTGGEVKKKLNCSFDVVNEIWNLQSGHLSLEQISVETYVVMCKNHIDGFGLIESGLAIDINTL
jgi:hypothetical protein